VAVLVDSNVLLDILVPDPLWSAQSSAALLDALNRGRVIINLVIYAEVSVGYDRVNLVDVAIPAEIERETMPFEVGFLAGKAFRRYRRSGGVRRSPLPDFFIGAHAALGGYDLLTRDPARYRSYFPALRLITP